MLWTPFPSGFYQMFPGALFRHSYVLRWPLLIEAKDMAISEDVMQGSLFECFHTGIKDERVFVGYT